MSEDKPDLIWVSDSYFKNTCHRNGSNLNYMESLIGSLWFDKDREEGKQWVPVDGDGADIGEGTTLLRARHAVEKNFRVGGGKKKWDYKPAELDKGK